MLYAGVAGACGEDQTLALEQDARDSAHTRRTSAPQGPSWTGSTPTERSPATAPSGAAAMESCGPKLTISSTTVGRLDAEVESWWSPSTTLGADLSGAGSGRGPRPRCCLTERLILTAEEVLAIGDNNYNLFGGRVRIRLQGPRTPGS